MAEDTSQSGSQPQQEAETAKVPPPPPQTVHTTLEDDFDVDMELLTPEEEKSLTVKKTPDHTVETASHKEEHSSKSVDHSTKEQIPSPSNTPSKPRFTRRQIFGWITSAIILLAILWGVFWSIRFVWQFFQSFSSQSVSTTSTTSHQTEVNNTTSGGEDVSVNLAPSDGWVHPSVYGSFLLGIVHYTFPGSTGVDTSFILGTKETTLTTHIEQGLGLVKKISSSLHTDVRQMLDNALHRTQALDDYVTLLEGYRTRVVQLQEALEAEMVNVQAFYTSHNETKVSAENDFFTAFNSYDAMTAQEALEIFISAQKNAGEEKAYYKAFVLLDNLYVKALNALDLRLKDITANRAALIEGIQVVDIVGSDLDLILPEESLSQ